MEQQVYIDNIETLSPEQIVEGILQGKVTFKALQQTERFDFSRQKKVKELISIRDNSIYLNAKTLEDFKAYLLAFPDGINRNNALLEVETISYNCAKSKEDLEGYLTEFPVGKFSDEAKKRIDKEIEGSKVIESIFKNINEFNPDEIVSKLSEEQLFILCEKLNLNPQLIKNYSEPPLMYGEIPFEQGDIPEEYTDVFFWGIPSSGKTTALSVIINTINKSYNMEAPVIKKQFGATYRASLINIFRNEIGYLPGRTNEDRTQYMPFLLYRRGENKKRKVSFFELSGEVFKFFFERVNNIKIINDNNREEIEKSFKTIELLLNSNNRKIHYFFIDYYKETIDSLDKNKLSQSNYLSAAATYFRDNGQILKEKTDAVFVVVTKADHIKEENKSIIAKNFLEENFGAFMDVLKNQCRQNSIPFNVKWFSIGNVYFNRICKIDRNASINIIEDLLTLVKVPKTWKFFNS